MAEIVIAQRFRGPSRSGNGGYVSGVLADLVDGPAEISLRAPPPLDTPMPLTAVGDGFEVRHEGRLVASVKPGSFSLDIPPCPDRAAAEAATAKFYGHVHSPVPHCFVCGSMREPGDALRVFTGPVEGTRLVAAPWRPHGNFAGEDGMIADRYVFAALDCPGAWAFHGSSQGNMLLGTIVGEVTGKVAPEEDCTVVAWPIREEGRKAFAGSAVFNAAGTVVASAFATWIVVPDLS
ncbi:MAG: hypothetical protein VYB54_16850 [Pseudomonadota bacterium]|nr:hypothetical protein [Pseudomonadota bacterium]